MLCYAFLFYFSFSKAFAKPVLLDANIVAHSNIGQSNADGTQMIGCKPQTLNEFMNDSRERDLVLKRSGSCPNSESPNLNQGVQHEPESTSSDNDSDTSRPCPFPSFDKLVTCPLNTISGYQIPSRKTNPVDNTEVIFYEKLEQCKFGTYSFWFPIYHGSHYWMLIRMGRPNSSADQGWLAEICAHVLQEVRWRSELSTPN